MPKFSEIIDRAIFRRCGIDVEPLARWWRSPIDSQQTNETCFKDSFSDSLVGDGVWQCILALDQADAGRQVSEEWLTDAVAAVQRSCYVQLDAAPLWLSWLCETTESVDLWRRCAAEDYNGYNADVFLTGIEFIRNGLPGLALSYWTRARRAVNHRARRERILRQRTALAIKEAQEYAAALSVNLPTLEGLDGDASLQVIVDWYDGLRDSAILEHFWRDHLEYLLRLREVDSNSSIPVLIRTAEKRSPLTIATLQKLFLVNRERAESLLQSLQALK